MKKNFLSFNLFGRNYNLKFYKYSISFLFLVILSSLSFFSFNFSNLKELISYKIAQAGTSCPAPASGNGIIICEQGGVSTTNYPIQIARPFVQGEIRDYPQAVINGTPVPTQADIKQRWPDGSVKHAIISFLIPNLEANSNVFVTFQNQTNNNNTPLSKDQMLSSVYDFDAKMELTNGQTQSVSARTMLQNGHYTYWTSGPIATTIILADHSANQTYDIGWKNNKYTILNDSIGSSTTTFSVVDASYIGSLNLPVVIKIDNEQLLVTAVNGNTLTVQRGYNNTSPAYHSVGALVDLINKQSEYVVASDNKYKSFRPIFHATFWPGINKVRVRYIGEISNTKAFQDQIYSLALKIGLSNPQVVYSKPTFTHYAGSRWTKEFWIGGTPSNVNINHNLKYLISTKFIPNYDLSKVVPESAISSAYSYWLNSSRDLYGSGNWTTAMGTTGGRPEIGPYPAWTVRWLYTFDSRMKEVALGNADLAGAWPVHFREGDSGRFFDRNHTIPALGKILSISARPTLGLVWGILGVPDTVKNDKIIPVGYVSSGGWNPDAAHQPDPFSVQYILTGDYWYLEQMQFWGAFGAAWPNRAYLSSQGLEYGLISDQVRGDAWVLRNRVHTAFISPDNTVEKNYFNTLIDDAIAIWEGRLNITGTRFQNTIPWSLGRSKLPLGGSLGLPPLRHWSVGGSDMAQQSPMDPNVTKTAMGQWEQHMLIWSLGRAKELGYEFGKILNWVSPFIIGEITDPGYNPYLLAAYRIPVTRVSDGNYFQSWSELKTGFLSTYNPQSFDLNDPEHGYPFIGLAAASQVFSEPNGQNAWSWIANQLLGAPSLNNNPKWAIIPREVSNVNNNLDTTPPSVSITYPTSGLTVSSTINIVASASDNVGVLGVQFKIDGQNIGQEDTSSPYSVSLNTLNYANGVHSLTATARDAAGNINTSNPVDINILNSSTSSTTSSSTSDTTTTTTTSTTTSQNLTLLLEASPSSGPAPLKVQLKARVSGSVSKTINYTFYCNRSDDGINITIPYSAKFDSQNATIKSYRCSYPYPGNYTAKVIVETGNLKPVEARANISVLQALSQTTQNNVSNTITSDTIIVNQKDSTQLNINNQTTTSISTTTQVTQLKTKLSPQEKLSILNSSYNILNNALNMMKYINQSNNQEYKKFAPQINSLILLVNTLISQVTNN